MNLILYKEDIPGTKKLDLFQCRLMKEHIMPAKSAEERQATVPEQILHSLPS